MIDGVTIRNFRCLRDVAAPLRPLTVLIGKNDTGKSVFLEALLTLSTPDKTLEPSQHWMRDSTVPTAVIAQAGGVPYQLSRKGTDSTRKPASAPPFSPGMLYRLNLAAICWPVKGSADGEMPPVLKGAESYDQRFAAVGVPAFLDYLLRRDRDRFFAIEEDLRGLVPGLAALEIATPDSSIRRLDFRSTTGLVLPAAEVSDGTKLATFFVCLAHHPNPPRLIMIEEPENGVHPKRLGDFVLLMRKLTKGELGGAKAQVVLSTHSPYLLDYINPQRDQVLVFSALKDGSRSVQPADAGRLKVFLDEFKLGEVWYNEGEEGLV